MCIYDLCGAIAELKNNYEEDKASLKEQLAEMRDSLQAATAKVTEMEEKLKSSEIEKKQLEGRLKNAEVKIEKLEQQGGKEDIGHLGGDEAEANSNKNKLYQSPNAFSHRCAKVSGCYLTPPRHRKINLPPRQNSYVPLPYFFAGEGEFFERSINLHFKRILEKNLPF